MRISSVSSESSWRSRSFSTLRRILAFQLLAAQLRVEVSAIRAMEIVWMMADRTCLGQPLGSVMSSGGMELAMEPPK